MAYMNGIFHLMRRCTSLRALKYLYLVAPSMQSDFTKEIIHTISKVDAGHQCYNTTDSASSIKAGSNATVQLEYISTYNGSENETFYACADIVCTI
jgi:hypothetical protein